MLNYAALAALSAVIRTGSHQRAAEVLGVTPSAISQRIKGLEERMGTTLLIRGPNTCLPTEAGERLRRHCDEVLLLEHALGEDVRGHDPERPMLRIAVNADSLAVWLLPALAAVEGVLFDLVCDDEGHSADWLRRGAVTAAVTSEPGPVQGCDSLALGRLRYLATATPEYVARWLPNGATPEALRVAPTLRFNAKDGLQDDWVRREAGEPLAPPHHVIPSTHGFLEATLAGMGWALNPESLVAEHLAQGRLCTIGAHPVMDVALYWQSARRVGPAMDRITGAIRHAARSVLHSPL